MADGSREPHDPKGSARRTPGYLGGSVFVWSRIAPDPRAGSFSSARARPAGRVDRGPGDNDAPAAASASRSRLVAPSAGPGSRRQELVEDRADEVIVTRGGHERSQMPVIRLTAIRSTVDCGTGPRSRWSVSAPGRNPTRGYAAAGDVSGWSFTFVGDLVPHRDARRLLGVSPQQLKRIPHVIAFAASPSKAKAAIGAALPDSSGSS